MADEAERIHVSPGVGAWAIMARPRSKSYLPLSEAQCLAGERVSSGGARASEANTPVRECGVKNQVSWDVMRIRFAEGGRPYGTAADQSIPSTRYH